MGCTTRQGAQAYAKAVLAHPDASPLLSLPAAALFLFPLLAPSLSALTPAAPLTCAWQAPAAAATGTQKEQLELVGYNIFFSVEDKAPAPPAAKPKAAAKPKVTAMLAAATGLAVALVCVV